jgi:hypothetical protein
MWDDKNTRYTQGKKPNKHGFKQQEETQVKVSSTQYLNSDSVVPNCISKLSKESLEQVRWVEHYSPSHGTPERGAGH